MTDDKLKDLVENVATRALLKATFKTFDELLMKQYRSTMAELTHAAVLRLRKQRLESEIYDLVTVFEAKNEIFVTGINIYRDDFINKRNVLGGIIVETEL